jgi:hypothetical protein
MAVATCDLDHTRLHLLAVGDNAYVIKILKGQEKSEIFF